MFRKVFLKIYPCLIVISDFLVTGPYLRRIIVDELGAPVSSIINCIPKEDFGGINHKLCLLTKI